MVFSNINDNLLPSGLHFQKNGFNIVNSYEEY